MSGSDARTPSTFSRSDSFEETRSADAVDLPQRDLMAGTSTPFFADATLDLDEAHDIAETPEPLKPSIDGNKLKPGYGQLQMPNLLVSTEEEDGDADDELIFDAPKASSPQSESNGLHLTPASSTASQREKTNFSRITSIETDLRRDTRPKNLPRWPRDLPWAIAFWLFAPASQIWPILIEKHDEFKSPLASHPLSTTSFHALLWAAAATFLLSRLYRTTGGGDGDDARHAAAQGLTIAAPLSVAVTIALAFFLWWACPQARWAILVPLWYTVRDLYLFRRWKRRSEQAGSGSRQAFFQALTCMSLDILSRSLRRESFYRVMSAILLVQFGVLMLWRWALLGALGSGSWVILLLAVIGGKWATGTVARFLSLLACGGVTGWFMEQSSLLEDMPEVSNRSGDPENDSVGHSSAGGSSIPEAYRTVDASVYQSVLALDDALDDDYEADDDEFMEAPGRNGVARRAHNDGNRSTVKSILWAGLTVSFGSVAQCGLLGGVAQFVWSQVRKVDAARTAIAQARDEREAGFRGMQIGNDGRGPWRLCSGITGLFRVFVSRFSDLAMSHVAAYYKTYQRAARDVAVLIEESGVEPVLHDDITTHMCASVGGSISGVIVLITGYVLAHQRGDGITDWQVAETLLLSFILSYTLLFTVMEPLRASIKAVYVSFAQHPRSLSQAFPLIFHRLSRLSESNTT